MRKINEYMFSELQNMQGLIAGDGELPVKVARKAQENGHKVICISLSSSNRRELKKYSSCVYSLGPGQVERIISALHENKIKQLTFIGKVSKSILFKNPRLDKSSLKLLSKARKLNDDALMMIIIRELEENGIETLDQTIFIKDLFVKKGVLGKLEPSQAQINDVEFGFELAKEIGRADIGQTVVVQNKMALAIEAIEGTDQAIKRGCKLGKNNVVIVKVSKPQQDKRFDIPTVGLRTLNVIKRYGGTVLAVEAGETVLIEPNRMIEYANKKNIVIMAI